MADEFNFVSTKWHTAWCWYARVLLAAVFLAQLSPWLWIGTVTEALAVHLMWLLLPAVVYFRREKLWSFGLQLAILGAAWPMAWQAYAERAPILSETVSVNQPAISCVSANVLWDNEEPEAAAKMLLALDADVVVCHEASKPFRRAFKKHGDYRSLYEVDDDGAFSILVASRFRLREVEQKVMVDGARTVLDDEGNEVTSQVRVVSVQVQHPDGLHIRVIAAHPPNPLLPSLGSARQQVLQYIRNEVQVSGREKPIPTILAADLNLTPGAYEFRRLHAAGWRQSKQYLPHTWLEPQILSFLRPFFGLRIDHVLVHSGLALGPVETLPIPGSDHTALFVRVGVPMANSETDAELVGSLSQ